MACKCTIPVQRGNKLSSNVGLAAHRDQKPDADWSVDSNHVVVVGTLSDRLIHSLPLQQRLSLSRYL